MSFVPIERFFLLCCCRWHAISYCTPRRSQTIIFWWITAPTRGQMPGRKQVNNFQGVLSVWHDLRLGSVELYIREKLEQASRR